MTVNTADSGELSRAASARSTRAGATKAGPEAWRLLETYAGNLTA